MLSPKEVVKKWVDAFNAGDVDMIVSLYDNNATNHQVKATKLSDQIKDLPAKDQKRIFDVIEVLIKYSG